MKDPDERIVEFERLNLLGKAVFLSGAAARVSATLLEKVIDRAADIVVDAERAFRQGRDPNVDEAKIIDERSRDDRVTPPPPQP